MKIVGGNCFLIALTPIFSSYLRAFGYTKESLWVNMGVNLLNILFNGIFLYLFKWGVAGVAVATVISRGAGLLSFLYLSTRKIKIESETETLPTKEIIRKILIIGVPSALETALYDIAMVIVMRFLNQMSQDGIYVTAKSYASQFTNFSYCAGAALAQANGIMTGWKIGEKKLEECQANTFCAAKIGLVVSFFTAATLAVLSKCFIPVFIQNPEVIRLVQKVLFLDILLELGRTSNLIFGCALKTSGDAIYTVSIAVIFTFLFAAGGTYFFGIILELKIIGAWIGLTADECMRAVLMALRWGSRQWEKKIFIQ